jgi:hypothetical protein
MTQKSATELEREAEATRARVVATADSIRDKMTPGQLFDEFRGHFAGEAASEMLRNLKTQIRDNPLPLTVIGAGLAWLMLGSGSSHAPFSPARTMSRDKGAHDSGSGSVAGARVSGAAGSVAAAASGAADTLSDMASGAAEMLKNSTADAGAATSEMAAKATHSAQDMLQGQPLAVAAIGLALGAAIGAMLPRTDMEDEQLGGYREKLRDSAEAAIEKGIDEAKQVAAEAYEAASDEAQRQSASDATIADKVSEVAKSAADKTEEGVRQRLSGSGTSSESNP